MKCLRNNWSVIRLLLLLFICCIHHTLGSDNNQEINSSNIQKYFGTFLFLNSLKFIIFVCRFIPKDYANSSRVHFQWYDQVYKNADGTVFNPLGSQNEFKFTYNCVCLIIGLLASARVIYKTVVTCNKGGWRPRHVLLISAIISCIFTLIINCLIPAVYLWWPNDDLCRFFVAFYSIPYVAFLFIILLAIIDRYVAVTRSIWHRTKFTKNRVFITLWLRELLF